MRKASSRDDKVARTDERTSTRGGNFADALLDELEQAVQTSAEFIQEFKELAHKLNLPGSEADSQTLDRAESLLLARLEAARRLATCSRDSSAKEIAAILRDVRRARLFVQLKIFRVDRVFHHEGMGPPHSDH